ncbi:MAG: M20/M25/M40 family metallo-hydrolase [Chloroflexota bacterium]|nr:M20/M25/M40 family metallo-hydrolase [Chloroflexota bacterium]
MVQIGGGAEVAALCRELVRCPSPSGKERGVADIVEREMRMLGYDEVLRDPLGSVLGIVHGEENGDTVLVDAHMDVVPATQPEAWRFPPYSAEWAEGRIWGRGATDIKGSLAAALVAIGMLSRDDLAGTVIMSASVGEEAIEGLALGHILDRYAPDAVIICEPTGLRLGLGHKGRAGLVLKAEGIAAHSSQPEGGVNAVYRMIEAISRVREVPLPQDELLGPGVSELVEMISSPYPGTSMVPEGCTVRFDRRLVRGETRQSVLTGMEEALEGVEGVDVAFHRASLDCYTGESFMVDDFHPAWALAPTDERVRRVLRALEKVGRGYYFAPYSTNGTSSAAEREIFTVIYGAGDIEQAHAIDEFVSVEALGDAFRGYQALVPALLKTQIEQ